jgi:acyl carrier protein
MNLLEPDPSDAPASRSAGAEHHVVDPLTMVLSAIADVAPEHAEALTTIDHDVDVWIELGLDSMDHLAVMDRLGNQLGVPIAAHDYPRLTTVRALVDHARTTGAHLRRGA